jgi:hypothetical protein
MGRRLGASRWRRGLSGATLAMMLLALVAAPVSAAQIIKQTGSTGPYTVTDTSGSPGARCGYGNVQGQAYALLRWIRVKAPLVHRAGSGSQPQHVSWQVRLQRELPPDTTWTTVASTSVQDGQATDSTPAAFTPLKVFFQRATHDGHLYRAVAVIKWYGGGGAVTGTLQLRIEHYGVKWTVGDPSTVFTDDCPGWAD